jgi:hypothetical protein
MSHFLSFYQNGTIVVVEFSADYSTTHTYSVKARISGADQHTVTLDPQMIDGRHDLLIRLDNGMGTIILYNIGDSFSLTPPQFVDGLMRI